MKSCAIFVVVLFLFACKYSKNQQYKVSDLFANTGSRNFKLSDEGSYYAYTDSKREYKELLVATVSENESKPMLINDTLKEGAVTNFLWLNDSSLLYTYKDTLGNTVFRKRDIKGSTLTIYPKFDKEYKILSNVPQKGSIYMAVKMTDSASTDVYSLDIHTGKLALYIKNFGGVYKWNTDGSGEVRSAIVSTTQGKELWFRNMNGTFRREFTFDVDRFIVAYFGGQDTAKIYLFQNVFQDKASIVSYDMNQHRVVATRYINPLYDVNKVYFSYRQNKIEAACFDSLYPDQEIFSISYKKMVDKFTDFFKNERFRYNVEDVSKNEKFRIVKVETDKFPGGYFLYDVANNSYRMLAEVSDLFPLEEQNGAVGLDTISFINKNGACIQGYFSATPIKKKAPLIIFLNRDIISRYVFGYRRECQFFANRGFHVYTINYSGSWGYGRKFMESGYHQIGKNIYTDILQGLQEVQKRYDVDTTCVLLYGMGMSGCIALQATTMPGHPFKGVIANSAYLNLFSYMKGLSLSDRRLQLIAFKNIGNPHKDIEYIKHISPIFNVNKIDVPVLLGYNLSDPLSSLSENLDFVRAMQAFHKEIYFFSTNTQKDIYNVDTYEVPFFETVDIFLKRLSH